MPSTPGRHLEAEIREQPGVWRRLANSGKALELARAIGLFDVVLVGSGSSLFMGQLGALALRRRGIEAAALAATEAAFDARAYRGRAVIALSQSGRSSDLLAAIDRLDPAVLIALTNDPRSPLARRAELTIDLEAGREIAVPATKSVTATAAIVLWAAALSGGTTTRGAATLAHTADGVEGWLRGEGVEEVRAAARRLAGQRSVVVVGAGYGVPIANELALKIKEASYLHAEGFAAGEFRHGSAAMLDARCAIVGIVDEASRAIVDRPLEEARRTGSLRYVIGGRAGDVPLIGPVVDEAFNTLAWLVAGQVLALEIGRARGIESDRPRGLSKVMIEPSPRPEP
jgi:glucosamine--fructose-6-phosphate aminotransferase (isomerizing)